MTASAPLEIAGPAAPPRSNGELVFAEPWEGRAFGLAVTLYDASVFEWSQFQAALIAQIAVWEREHPAGECFSYYRCWLAALESVLAQTGLVTPHDIADRTAALATRPPGHHDVGAFLAEHAGNGTSDAAACSGDHAHLSAEPEFHGGHHAHLQAVDVMRAARTSA